MVHAYCSGVRTIRNKLILVVLVLRRSRSLGERLFLVLVVQIYKSTDRRLPISWIIFMMLDHGVNIYIMLLYMYVIIHVCIHVTCMLVTDFKIFAAKITSVLFYFKNQVCLQ